MFVFFDIPFIASCHGFVVEYYQVPIVFHLCYKKTLFMKHSSWFFELPHVLTNEIWKAVSVWV